MTGKMIDGKSGRVKVEALEEDGSKKRCVEGLASKLEKPFGRKHAAFQ